MCVSVAEGMPGQRKLLADEMMNAGIGGDILGVHTEIDAKHDHSSFPRRLMAQYCYIDGRSIHAAHKELLRILELSQRGWSDLISMAETSNFA